MRTEARRGQIIGLALVATLLLTGSGQVARAQESGVSMTATVGFDGTCRLDRWCPVTVVLANEGTDIEGELRLSLGEVAGETRPDSYTRPIQLPAHSRKAFTLYVPTTAAYYYSYGAARLSLKVELVVEGEVLASEVSTLRTLDAPDRLYGDRLVGVVSSAPSALNFLASVPPPSGDAVVAQLSLETLPPAPLGWEPLDVLILNDVDTTALSAEQRRALETWLTHGGHLIVGGGAGAARTAAGVADLLPVTVGTLRTVETLDGLDEQIGAATVPGPYPLAESILVAGEVLIWQDDLPLVARRSLGAGTVDFLAFDAGLNPFATWEDNARLWASLVEADATLRTTIRVRDVYAANEAVTTIPEVRLPSLLQIIGFMLAYIVLIGPVNYLVLRKLDRRELAWLTIPALIAGFTVLAYLTGFQLRGHQPILHRLAVVTVPEEGDSARVTELVGLFSPWRTRYDVQAQGAGIRSIPADMYGNFDVRSLDVTEDIDTWTAGDVAVDVGGIQPFAVEGYVPAERPQADLRFVAVSASLLWVEGTIQNGPVPLHNARLIIGQREQSLGDLAAGQTVQVPTAPPILLVLPSTAPYYGTSSTTPEAYRRDQFTQAFFAGMASLGSEVYLVGWSDQSPLDVSLVGRTATTSGLAFYIYTLPVAPRVLLPGLISTTVPASAIIREVESPDTTSLYGIFDPGQIPLSAGQPVVFRFSILPQVMVDQVDTLTLDLSATGSPALPEVELWNLNTGEWERVQVRWGLNVIPDPAAYVSRPAGIVRVRLSTDGYITLSEVSIGIEGRY